ncbi:hypothetical protein ACIKTA_18105, partial [Hansschlegelia beijingensis]
DLVPDLTQFYAQHASIEPWLKTDTREPGAEWRQSREDRAKLDPMSVGGVSLPMEFPLSQVRRACKGVAPGVSPGVYGGGGGVVTVPRKPNRRSGEARDRPAASAARLI